MGKVHLEIIPWLTTVFNQKGAGRLILEEDVGEETTIGDLLNNLAARNRAFGEIAFDSNTHKLTGQVSVVVNDRLLELLQGLETQVKDGDTIILLPAYAGG